MKRRGLDGTVSLETGTDRKPHTRLRQSRVFFLDGPAGLHPLCHFLFCSVVLFPGACIGLMGLSMRRSPAWEPDEQGTDSIKRVFRLSGKNRFPRMFRSFLRVLPGRGRRGIWPFPERQNNLPFFSPCRSLGCFPSIPVSFYR